MSAHTPGPWQIDDWGDDKPGHEMWGNSTLITSRYRIDRGLHGNDVAYVAPIRLDNGTSPEQSANARLIAAAPTLLEAMEDLVAALDMAIGLRRGDFYYERKNARAAIAKAKGDV